MKNFFIFLESLSVYSEESEDNMSVEEAKSETDSNNELEDDEEYETITISEAAVDEAHYDQDIDMLEEKQAMKKFKGNIIIYILRVCVCVYIYVCLL